MPLPKGLFEQVGEFARAAGPKLRPEETAAALQKLQDLGPTLKSKFSRGKDINSVLESGMLQDPDLERAYAIGSSVTKKEFPTDLDLLVRGKTGRETGALLGKYGDLPNKPYDEALHVTTPVDVTSEGAHLRYKNDLEMNSSSARTAHAIAKKGVERYGEDHKWIRLVAIPSAVGLGIMAPGDRDEAEAGIVSGLKRLLNQPVTRRGFIQGVVQEGKDLNLLKKAKSTGKNDWLADRGKVASEASIMNLRQRKEGLNASEAFDGLWEEAGGIGKENLDNFVKNYKSYYPDIRTKDLERIHALAAPEDRSTLKEAGDLLIYKLLSIPGVNKKDILSTLRNQTKSAIAFERKNPGMTQSVEAWKELEKEQLRSLDELGITFTSAGIPRIPKDKIAALELLADKVKDAAIEGVTEVGVKVVEQLGKKEMSRRGFFKGFGLGKGAAVAGATAASQIGGEGEAEAGFKPADVAKAAAALIKQNKDKLRYEPLQKAIKPGTEQLGPRGWEYVEGKTYAPTSRRLGSIIDSMIKIPSKEYKSFDNLIIKPFIHDPESLVEGQHYSGRSIIDYGKLHPSKLYISSQLAGGRAFPHEVTHSRQVQSPRMMRYLDELQAHVEKWKKGDWERYYENPVEVHARGMEAAVKGQPSGPIEQSLYDQIYNQQLHKAIQYTEKWLKEKDPTFKASFIKNVAIGGAVMVAMQLGPDGDVGSAEAMPPGVYKKAGELVGEVSSSAKRLVGKVMDGKTVQNVLKGKDKERRVIFTDGTESSYTTKEIESAAIGIGRKKYVGEILPQKDEEGKLMQAMKSLQIHIKKAEHRPFPNSDMKRRWADEHLTLLEDAGIKDVPGISFVSRGNYVFTMPTEYAEILERAGQLEIIKSKKYLDILNKHKVK